MKYKFRDLTIVNNRTLSSEDLLGREKSISVFKKLIDESQDGGVIALHGTWGIGKTTFVKMLMENLPEQEYNCVYYNAWQYDHSNDPLLPLIAEFKNVFANVPTEKVEKFTWSLAKVSLDALPSLSSTIVSMIPGGGLFSEASKDAMKRVTEMINGKIDEYLDFKNSIEGFQKAIQDCLCTDRQLVFFIDELDRCAPSFAVRTLELIKHLFIVPNVVFVLSIDKVQLAHSIRGYYGSQEFDAVDYLRRFVDIEYNLPMGSQKELIEKYAKDFEFEKLCTKKKSNYSFDDFLVFVYLIAVIRKLSIRQIEKWMVALGYALENSKNLNVDATTIAMLTYMRTFDYGFYIQYYNWEVKDQEVIDYLEKNFHSQLFDIGTTYGRCTAHQVVAQIIWLRYGDSTLRGFVENVLDEGVCKLEFHEITEEYFLDCITDFNIRMMAPFISVMDAIEMNK